MKLFTALFLLFTASTALANPFPTGNAQAGKALFDKYNCNSCHAAMLGGDGNTMFTREARKVRSPADLVEQLKLCSGNIGASLTAQDEQHLGAYLNRYYKLK
ncbi:MAG: cytochrome c [Gallionella sp.]|nr:cytochrome c [Gallionella sp.]